MQFSTTIALFALAASSLVVATPAPVAEVDAVSSPTEAAVPFERAEDAVVCRDRCEGFHRIGAHGCSRFCNQVGPCSIYACRDGHRQICGANNDRCVRVA